MVNEQLMGAWDQPSRCIIMSASQPTPVQKAALDYMDKAALFVEQNERLLEQRYNYYSHGNFGGGGGKGRGGYNNNNDNYHGNNNHNNNNYNNYNNHGGNDNNNYHGNKWRDNKGKGGKGGNYRQNNYDKKY